MLYKIYNAHSYILQTLLPVFVLCTIYIFFVNENYDWLDIFTLTITIKLNLVMVAILTLIHILNRFLQCYKVSSQEHRGTVDVHKK